MRRQQEPEKPSSLRVPVRRQSLTVGLPFAFTESGVGVQFDLLMLWTALNSVNNQDLSTSARNAAYAIGKFAERQKFAPMQPLAEDVLKAAHPLHPRKDYVIRKKAEPLMNTAHRFMAGYRDNSQCDRIRDLAMGIVDQIERIARDVLGVWITWFGIDDKLKPPDYWREQAAAVAPAQKATKTNKKKTGALYGIVAVVAGLLIGFILHRLSLAPLWQILGSILAVLCVLAIPLRLLIMRRMPIVLVEISADDPRLT